jgi:hypothetical protein
VSLGALGAGVALMLMSSSKGSTAASLQTSIQSLHHNCVAGGASYDAQCEDLKSNASSGDDLNRVGVVLLIGGGVVGAATLVYALFPRDARSTTSGRVTPVVAPGFAGLTAAGTF